MLALARALRSPRSSAMDLSVGTALGSKSSQSATATGTQTRPVFGWTHLRRAVWEELQAVGEGRAGPGG
eukprot:6203871-Pleurochrysis_carterae.AAC.1